MLFLLAFAETLGISEQEFQRALETGTYAPTVRSHFLGGVRSGVNGTPPFFNNRRHDSPFDFEHLAGSIAIARSGELPETQGVAFDQASPLGSPLRATLYESAAGSCQLHAAEPTCVELQATGIGRLVTGARLYI